MALQISDQAFQINFGESRDPFCIPLRRKALRRSVPRLLMIKER